MQQGSPQLTLAHHTLVVLLFFGALSAAIGAVMGVAFNGAGVPLAYLEHSPFSTYLVPGLVLGVVVGGTQLAAAIALVAKRRRGLFFAACAGFGMQIWIFAELAIIEQYMWLQTAYFALGVLELVLVLLLLGVTRSEPAASAPKARGAAYTNQR